MIQQKFTKKTPKYDTNHIKETYSFGDFFERVTGQEVRRGVTNSPFRTDRTPSFGVTEYGYRDFSTGESGDIIRFTMQYFDMSFVEACAYITGDAPQTAIPVPKISKPKSSIKRATPEWQSTIQTHIQSAHEHLLSDECTHVREWLFRRGITFGLILQHQLGYVPKTIKTPLNYVASDGKTKPVRIYDGVTIPHYVDNELVAVKIRRGKDAPMKYIAVGGGDTHHLYNVDSIIEDTQAVVVCEGEFDAILLQSTLPDEFAVVTAGSASFHYDSLDSTTFDQLADKHLFLALDADKAGQKATQDLTRLFPHAKALRLPEEQDVSDYLNNDGDLSSLFQTSLAPYPLGVPNTLRSTMLRFLPQSSAFVFELMNEGIVAGHIETGKISKKAIYEAGQIMGWKIPQKTIYRAFGDLVEAGVLDSLSKLHTVKHLLNSSTLIEKTVCKNDNKYDSEFKRGGQQQFYAVADHDTIVTNLLEYARPRLLESVFTKREKDLAQMIPIFEPLMLESLDVGVFDRRMFAANKPVQEQSALEGDTLVEALNEKAIQAGAHGEETGRRHQQVEYLLERLKKSLQQRHSTRFGTYFELNSAKNYRANYLRSYTEEQDGTQLSRRELARLLGCSVRSTDSILAHAGIESEKNVAHVEILSPENLSQQLYKIQKKHAGKAVAFTAVAGDTRSYWYGPNAEGRNVRMPSGEMWEDVALWMKDAQSLGAKIQVEIQQANSQSLGEIPEIVPKKRKTREPRVSIPNQELVLTQDAVEEALIPNDAGYKGRMYRASQVRLWVNALLEAMERYQIVRDDGWRVDVADAETGEMYRGLTPMEVVALITGQYVPPHAETVPLLLYAIEEFGAVIR